MRARLIRLLDGENGGYVDYSAQQIYLAPSYMQIGKEDIYPPYSEALVTHEYLGIPTIDI